MDFIVLVLMSMVVFLGVDLLWLVKIAPKMYKKFIGHLMAPKFNGIAALLFYSMFMVGFVFFVVQPGIISGSWTTTLGLAAMFGMVTYGTYDLTNWATLKDWPAAIVAIDMVWGTFLSSASALIVFVLANWWGI